MADIATANDVSPEIIQKLVLDGDLSKMNQQQKVEYYNRFCGSLGLNSLTQPFQIIKFQGKEKLYATKDCTEQLRKIHGVSIIEITSQELRGVFIVTAKAQDKSGKTDAATGAVTVEGLKGESLANALMKAETKAKRRVTLSICGLGMLDESELDTMPVHQTATVTQDAQSTEIPILTKDHPKFPAVRDKIMTAKTTIDKAQEHFVMADDVIAALEAAQIDAIKGLCVAAHADDDVKKQYVKEYMGEIKTATVIIDEIKARYGVQFING